MSAKDKETMAERVRNAGKDCEKALRMCIYNISYICYPTQEVLEKMKGNSWFACDKANFIRIALGVIVNDLEDFSKTLVSLPDLFAREIREYNILYYCKEVLNVPIDLFKKLEITVNSINDDHLLVEDLIVYYKNRIKILTNDDDLLIDFYFTDIINSEIPSQLNKAVDNYVEFVKAYAEFYDSLFSDVEKLSD